MVEPATFQITALGAQGDGIANGTVGTVFVPFALPGERWARESSGFALQGPPSPERQTAPCRHFGTCGGCVAQHLTPAAYARWKRQILVDAFQKADINAAVAPLRTISPGSRRRLVLSARMLPSGVAVGYHARGSDRLLAIEECTIADPMIIEALPALHQLAARLLPRRDEMRMTVTRCDAGLDVAIEGGKKDIDAADRAVLADVTAKARILRLSADRDVVIRHADPVLTMGTVKVVPPPNVFLQASVEAERALIELVSAAVGKAKAVVDLFAGLGTFALPLALKARVLAVDSDASALGALDAAARNSQGLKPIEIRTRDLVREPLARKELEGFDAVVFDPPRAGAETQAAMLAKSAVAKVVAVSCNPTSLARDAGILLDGGYELESLTPIDQFLYSHHLEAVAVFARPSGKKRKR